MKSKPYSCGELDKIIKLRMLSYSPEEIAEVVDRTKISIDRLLSVLKKERNLVYPKLTYRNCTWDSKRIESMAKDYPKKTYQQLGKENGGISASRIWMLMAKRAQGLQQGTWCA